MKAILTLVEGQTEERFFKESCALSKPLRVLPNGKDVPLDKVVEVIVANVELHSADFKTILIWYDREGRQVTSAQMATELADKVAARVSNRQILVGIPDRKIENWILADEELIRAESKRADYEYDNESKDGKGILRELLGGSSLGPTVTARLLKTAVASRISAKSVSFSSHHPDLAKLDWYWPKR